MHWVFRLCLAAMLGLAAHSAAAQDSAGARDDLRSLGPALCSLTGHDSASPEQILALGESFDCSDGKLDKSTYTMWLKANVGEADAGLADPVLWARTSRHGAVELSRQFADGTILTTHHSLEDQARAFRSPYAILLPYAREDGALPDTLLFRIDNPFDPTNWLDIEILDRTTETAIDLRSRTISAFVLGLLFAPLLLNAVFFVALRQRFILFHSLMVVGLIVNHLAWSGMIFDIMPQVNMAHRSIMVYMALATVGMAASLLISSICDPDRLGRRGLISLRIAGIGCFVSAVVIMLASPWLPFVGAQVYHAIFGLMVLVVLVNLLRSAWRGDRMAALQLAGLSGTALVAASRVLRAMGLIPDLPLFDLGFYFAILLEAFTTSVIVALRALQLRRQYDAIAIERDQVARVAGTDELTGLPNRRAFFAQYGRVLTKPDAANPVRAVMVLDLDRFKAINDNFGHAVGDAVLRDFAARMQEAARPGDLLARFGGEEFVIFAEFADEADAWQHSMQLCNQALRWTGSYEGAELAVACSIGVAIIDPGDPADFDTAFRSADDALYLAKEAGRGQVCLVNVSPRRDECEAGTTGTTGTAVEAGGAPAAASVPQPPRVATA